MFNARGIYNDEVEHGTKDPLASVIFQALGAASTCWDDDGVFKDAEAKQIGDSLYAFLRTEFGVNDRAEVYRDKAGEYRYRIIARNGLVVDAATQGYSNRFSATRGARRGRRGVKIVQIRR